jgi:hypothetical protein
MNNPDLLGKVKEFTAVKKRTPAQREAYAKKHYLPARVYFEGHPNMSTKRGYFEGRPSVYVYDTNEKVGLRGKKGLVAVFPDDGEENYGYDRSFSKKLENWVRRQPDWDEWAESDVFRRERRKGL